MSVHLRLSFSFDFMLFFTKSWGKLDAFREAVLKGRFLFTCDNEMKIISALRCIAVHSGLKRRARYFFPWLRIKTHSATKTGWSGYVFCVLFTAELVLMTFLLAVSPWTASTHARIKSCSCVKMITKKWLRCAKYTHLWATRCPRQRVCFPKSSTVQFA